MDIIEKHKEIRKKGPAAVPVPWFIGGEDAHPALLRPAPVKDLLWDWSWSVKSV